MLREALKTALLDLKGQMRGRRASSYLKKEEARHEKKEKELGEDEEDESVVEHVMGGSKGSDKAGEDSDMGGKGLDPELKAEMSNFMSKRRKGSTKGGPTKSVFASIDMPKPKMKGKMK